MGKEKAYLLLAHECSICPEEKHSVKNGRSVDMTESKVLFLYTLQIPTAKDRKQIQRERREVEGRTIALNPAE